MTGRRTAVLAVVLTGGLLLSTLALAFQRSRDPTTQACLWWKNRQVEVYLNRNCSSDVPAVDCQNAVWTTLANWNAAVCSDFNFVAAGADGLTDSTDVGFDEDHWNDNINLIVFQESYWGPLPEHSESAIALTTTTYDRLTGQIVDTDVEFNGVNFTFTTAESEQVLVDIANTLAHEAGHMLGLDHSSFPDSSMWSTAPAGETKKRDLSQDDIDGVCHVYPIGQKIPPCEGFVPPPGDGGCDCDTSAGADGLWFFLLFASLFALRTRRRFSEV